MQIKAYGTFVETKFFGSALLRCPDLGAKQVTPQKIGCFDR
jgi:hypothetical protein